MSRYFILRDGEVVEEPDFDAWSSWYSSSFRQVELVARATLEGSVVSTRFLGVSLGLSAETAPQLFETSVEGGWLDRQGERFATLAEARAGHDRWVARVREVEEENRLPPPGTTW